MSKEKNCPIMVIGMIQTLLSRDSVCGARYILSPARPSFVLSVRRNGGSVKNG